MNSEFFYYLQQDRTPGEVFVPKSSKDAEIERIMRSMSVRIIHLLEGVNNSQ